MAAEQDAKDGDVLVGKSHKENDEDDNNDDDDDGFFMADFFTKDLDMEDTFEYNYGELKICLKGVAREYGQMVLGSGDGTGLTIWRGAEELCNYLWGNPQKVEGKRCIELGAGLGLVGILLSHLRPSVVVITDGDDDAMKRILENFIINGFVEVNGSIDVQQNIIAESHAFPLQLRHSNNRSKLCFVCKFLWQEEEHRQIVASLGSTPNAESDSVPDSFSTKGGVFDLIVAADVVYEVGAVVPLIDAVATLLEKTSTALFILSFARRNVPVQKVIDEAKDKGLICKRIEDFQCATSGENIYEFQWDECML